MPSRWIPWVKVAVHVVCVWPFVFWLLLWKSGKLDALADPVNWLTHATGNFALWTLLVSLAVTPVRRLHPKLANLIRFRRLLGLYAFFYATLHLATYAFLFSGYDLPTAWAGVRQGHVGEIVTQWKVVWPRMVEDLLKRRFIQVGLAAWVILLALAVTSPQRVLRAMGGKNWQRLHRLVYVAGVLACVHYWWLVKAGVRTPLTDTLLLTGLLLARVVWVWWKGRGVRVAVGRPATAG